MSPPTRPYRDPVLAQELSWNLSEAACKRLTGWWAARERTHAATVDPAARKVVVQEVTQVCCTCPHLDPCALLAETDGYTGLAAANAYLNGRRVTPAASVNPPRRSILDTQQREVS